MKASLESHTFFPDRLNAAVAQLIEVLGVFDDRAEELHLKDLLRTTYAACNNSNVIAEDKDFALRIQEAACTAAQVELIRRIAKIEDLVFLAMHLHLEGRDVITPVIEDLMTE